MSKTVLPATLAQRVRFLREQRMLSAEYVAHHAQISLKQLDDIESGLEMFLAPAVRQRLARILHVPPRQLKEVEKPPRTTVEEMADIAFRQQKGGELMEAIMANPQGKFRCPECNELLNVRVFERRDLHDQPFTVIKAHCNRCLFRLTTD